MTSRKKKSTPGPFEALRRLKDELAKAGSDAPTTKAERPAPSPRRAPPLKLDEPDEPEDEALLFHRLFAGVEPLDRSRGRLPRQPIERSASAEQAAKRGQEQVQAESDAVHTRLRALVEGGTRFEVADDGRRVEGRRDDVPLESVRRLRRGLSPIDARLDLHGLRAQEAHLELERFLAAMRGRGERCVLVIHGKGEHSPLGVGVLRGEMAAWLSQGASSRHVAAFTTAREVDGGEGALYVLLRR
jgi:DNA-nicking Smr family endonuclease